MIANTTTVMNTKPRITPSTGPRNEGVPLGLGTSLGRSVRLLDGVVVAWYGYQVVIFEVLYCCWKRAIMLAFEEMVPEGAVCVALPVPVPPIMS